MKILQCHTKGDKRFSPFCCYVMAFGMKKSIENHYQTAKRFKGQSPPTDWKSAKAMQKAGYQRIGFELPNGLWLPPDTNKVDDLAVQFYIALWYKYLLLNPQLVAMPKAQRSCPPLNMTNLRIFLKENSHFAKLMLYVKPLNMG